MKPNDADVSLVKHSFGEGGSYWSSTIDFTFLDIQSQIHELPDSFGVKEYLDGIILAEECNHRFRFLGFKTRLDMSWLEALTSYELLQLLNDLRNLNKSNPIEIIYPLQNNLNNGQLSHEILFKIRNIFRALRILTGFGNAVNIILECFALRLIHVTLGDSSAVFNQIKDKKYGQYTRMKELYPLFDEGLNNIRFSNLGQLQACIFNPSLNEVPGLTTMDVFDYFNENKARNLLTRFENILDVLCIDQIDSESDFVNLLKENGLDFIPVEEYPIIHNNYYYSQIWSSPFFLPVFLPMAHAYNDKELNEILQVVSQYNSKDEIETMLKEGQQRKQLENLFSDNLAMRGRSTVIMNPMLGDNSVQFKKSINSEDIQPYIDTIKFTFFKYRLFNENAESPFPLIDIEKELLNGININRTSVGLN